MAEQPTRARLEFVEHLLARPGQDSVIVFQLVVLGVRGFLVRGALPLQVK